MGTNTPEDIQAALYYHLLKNGNLMREMVEAKAPTSSALPHKEFVRLAQQYELEAYELTTSLEAEADAAWREVVKAGDADGVRVVKEKINAYLRAELTLYVVVERAMQIAASRPATAEYQTAFAMA